LLLALSGPALADDDDDDDEASDPSYWSMQFRGGVMLPIRGMEDTFQSGIAGGVQFGWVSKIGLGFDINGEYTPLPRKDVPDLENFETHFVAATFMPKFVVGKTGTVRIWVAGGGGMAAERTKATYRDQPTETMTEFVPIFGAAAALELHLISSGGLVVGASYLVTGGDVNYKFVNATGGLVFTF
jgi:hypothetical protein